jgi:hypothetical protein
MLHGFYVVPCYRETFFLLYGNFLSCLIWFRMSLPDLHVRIHGNHVWVLIQYDSQAPIYGFLHISLRDNQATCELPGNVRSYQSQRRGTNPAQAAYIRHRTGAGVPSTSSRIDEEGTIQYDSDKVLPPFWKKMMLINYVLFLSKSILPWFHAPENRSSLRHILFLPLFIFS